ncbi:amino acid ABC transporter permease [Leucobacter japonicus]|uniref:amino acid ABC transporter permease n=1 Tax=Leucobacter japonicus TaxID=1461259 RepID=UPI0006A7E120|nr:amino acid ABC transporter permease [Leucobacter japonicus]
MNDTSWLWDWPTHIPNLLPGLGVAILLTVVSCFIGYPLGFFLAILSESRNRAVRWATIVVVEVGRGIPALVLLYLVYRGLPQLGVLLDALPSAIIALTVTAAAYSAEMIRASIAALPPGQTDAAEALGLSRSDRFRFVILPQAARISIPPLVNLTITMFHITSLASVITVAEIMHAAYLSGAISWRYMSVYIAAAFVYAFIAIPGAILAGRIEQRVSGGSAGPRRRLRRGRRDTTEKQVPLASQQPLETHQLDPQSSPAPRTATRLPAITAVPTITPARRHQ